MRYLKAIALAALAALAVSEVVGAGTASATEPKAEPEGGAFSVSFTGSGGTGVLETTSESGNIRTVDCTGNTNSGEINTANTAKNITVKFTGCTASGSLASAGPAPAQGQAAVKSVPLPSKEHWPT